MPRDPRVYYIDEQSQSGLVRKLVTDGITVINPTLDGAGNVIGPYNDLMADGVTPTPAGASYASRFLSSKGSPVDVRAWGAKCDTKLPGDGQILIGTPTVLTSASAAFTAADPGKLIFVWGAGAAGVDLATTIATFVNATTVTLTVAASTGVSGAQFFYGSDDTIAIQAALNSFGTNNYNWQGGIVLQSGLSCITARLIVPFRVRYIGVAHNASGVVAMGGFPTSTELVRLGDLSGSIGMGCSLENMSLYCNGIAGSIGTYSERINEESGWFRVSISDFVAYGIFVNQPGAGQPPQNYSIDDVELLPAHHIVVGTQCITVTHGAANQLDPRTIRKVTCVPVGATLTAAIVLDGIGSRLEDIHIEQCVDGILVGSVHGCTGLQIENYNAGPTVTNCIHYSNASAYVNYGVKGLTAAGAGYTNAIVDNHQGWTLTGAVSEYQVGNGSPGAESFFYLGNGTAPAFRFKGLVLDSNGHVLSTNASGPPTTSNLGANVTSVTPTGKDWAGKIVIVMAAGLAANTRICTVTYGAGFAAIPGLILLVNETSGVGLADVNFYPAAEASGAFDLTANQALVAGTYTIKYLVIG